MTLTIVCIWQLVAVVDRLVQGLLAAVDFVLHHHQVWIIDGVHVVNYLWRHDLKANILKSCLLQSGWEMPTHFGPSEELCGIEIESEIFFNILEYVVFDRLIEFPLISNQARAVWTLLKCNLKRFFFHRKFVAVYLTVMLFL